MEHCFINPLEFWSKQLLFFSYSLCLTKPGEYPAEFYLFSILLYSTCSQTETQLAENNPLQHYYLSPAVIAAMSFSMIVYQAAYLCRHDNSVNNRWVLSFRLRCEIDSVTYAVSFLWKQRDLVVLKSSSSLPWRILQGGSEYRTLAPAAVTPSLPVAHLAGEENLLLPFYSN